MVGTPKSSTYRWVCIINPPFWGTPIVGNPRIYTYIYIILYMYIYIIYIYINPCENGLIIIPQGLGIHYNY